MPKMLTTEGVVEELARDGISREVVEKQVAKMLDDGIDEVVETVWQCVQIIWGIASATDMMEEFQSEVLDG